MLDRQTAEQALEQIRRDYGSLDDLSHELANTIANLYYRHNAFLNDFERSGGRIVPHTSDDIVEGLKDLFSSTSRDSAFVKAGPGMIQALRDLKREAGQSYFGLASQVLLDTWKFRIENAMQKPGYRRAIERYFKRKSVREIPDMLEIMRKCVANE